MFDGILVGFSIKLDEDAFREVAKVGVGFVKLIAPVRGNNC
jgi:hypothetical protein